MPLQTLAPTKSGIAAWSIDVRCRAQEPIAVIDAAVIDRDVPAGTLTLGTDNGSGL